MLCSILRGRGQHVRCLSHFARLVNRPVPQHQVRSRGVAPLLAVSAFRRAAVKYSTESVFLLDPVKYDEVCTETLESLCDYFEEIVEGNPHLKSPDVVYGDGVLTVAFGEPYGTYVINRQSPNKQIWLSSPTSGPKRYDYVQDKGSEYWIYKHDGISLHQLLQKEISLISKMPLDFARCSYSIV